MIFSSKKILLQNSELEKKLCDEQKRNQDLMKEIEDLRSKRKILEEENQTLKKNGDLIIQKAKETAEQSLNEARLRYEREITRLRLFVERWLNALPEIKEMTLETRKRRALALALSEILKNNPCIDDIDQGVQILEKLDAAVSGKGEESGEFNLDEVLNPEGELDLATLCKELGVMD